jgi:hypothetical protein
MIDDGIAPQDSKAYCKIKKCRQAPASCCTTAFPPGLFKPHCVIITPFTCCVAPQQGALSPRVTSYSFYKLVIIRELPFYLSFTEALFNSFFN